MVQINFTFCLYFIILVLSLNNYEVCGKFTNSSTSKTSSSSSSASSSRSSNYGSSSISSSSSARKSTTWHMPASSSFSHTVSNHAPSKSHNIRRNFPVTERTSKRYDTNTKRPSTGLATNTERPQIRHPTRTESPNIRVPISKHFANTEQPNIRQPAPSWKRHNTTSSRVSNENNQPSRNVHAKNTSVTHDKFNSSTNTTRKNFHPSSPSFADIERTHENAQRNPVTQRISTSHNFQPSAPALENKQRSPTAFNSDGTYANPHSSSAPPMETGWDIPNQREVKKQNDWQTNSSNIAAGVRPVHTGWNEKLGGYDSSPYPTNQRPIAPYPSQGPPLQYPVQPGQHELHQTYQGQPLSHSPAGRPNIAASDKPVHIGWNQQLGTHDGLPYPTNQRPIAPYPAQGPPLQYPTQHVPHQIHQSPPLLYPPIGNHPNPYPSNPHLVNQGQQFYQSPLAHPYQSHTTHTGPYPSYSNQPYIIQAPQPAFQSPVVQASPRNAPNIYGTGFSTPYIPPPPPPGYTYRAYPSVHESKDSKHKDILFGLALWQLSKQTKHQNHQHFDTYQEPYISYQLKYNPRPNVVGSHNTVVMTNFVSNTTTNNGSIVGTMACRSIFNLGAVKKWVNRTKLDFKKQFPNETFPELVNGTIANYTAVPGNIIHNQTVLITCCGTNGPPVKLSYLTNGKSSNVNCISKLGKISLRKMTFIKHSATNTTNPVTTPNPFEGPWVPVTLIHPENRTANTASNSTAGFDINVPTVFLNTSSMLVLVRNNDNSTLATATLTTGNHLNNTHTSPTVGVTQSPSELVIG